MATEASMQAAEMILDALVCSWRTMERAADIVEHRGIKDEAIHLRYAANRCRNAIATLRDATPAAAPVSLKRE